MSAVYVVGDIHGQLDKLAALLQEAALIDAAWSWAAGESTLWFAGDFLDHGPDGAGVVALIMRLQREASRAGGRVAGLLGNHDVLFLAAHRFGATRTHSGETLWQEWQESGGETSDLERITAEQVSWLSALPAMVHEGDDLLVHADATFYTRYGDSVAEVNQAIGDLLHDDDVDGWKQLLVDFGEHRTFTGEPGKIRAAALLERFGGQRIIHGHSPICTITGEPAEEVREPLIYADGICVDVDAGMYLGGPGFIYLSSAD